jgi:hypothetical protein
MSGRNSGTRRTKEHTLLTIDDILVDVIDTLVLFSGVESIEEIVENLRRARRILSEALS